MRLDNNEIELNIFFVFSRPFQAVLDTARVAISLKQLKGNERRFDCNRKFLFIYELAGVHSAFDRTQRA